MFTTTIMRCLQLNANINSGKRQLAGRLHHHHSTRAGLTRVGAHVAENAAQSLVVQFGADGHDALVVLEVADKHKDGPRLVFGFLHRQPEQGV